MSEFDKYSLVDRQFKSHREHPTDNSKTKIGADVENDASNPIPIYAPTPLDVTVSLSNTTTPTIYNVITVLANTEYSQALPADTKEFLLRCRVNAVTKFAFIATQSGTNYIEVPVGTSFSQTGVKLTGITIYFQTNVPGATVELLVWT